MLPVLVIACVVPDVSGYIVNNDVCASSRTKEEETILVLYMKRHTNK